MRKITIVAAMLCFCALPGAGADELEEIIVTATKRETRLMDISTAVTAFDANTLEALNIDNAQDLVARTPSLAMTGTPQHPRRGPATQRPGHGPGRGDLH